MKHVVQESVAKNAALNVALHERNRVLIDSNQFHRKAEQFLTVSAARRPAGKIVGEVLGVIRRQFHAIHNACF